ncbi:MAG: hypothetical protein AAGA75_06825 [Cyanobacteria bacterium P01_E01_bin.6]
MTVRKPQFTGFNALLAGGLIVTLIGLMIDVQTRNTKTSVVRPFAECEGDIQTNVALTEEQLAHVLTIPERDSREKIRTILSTPYCTLPKFEVRSGVESEREVYSLAFAQQSWLILLFEGDEYAGYRISNQ